MFIRDYGALMVCLPPCAYPISIQCRQPHPTIFLHTSPSLQSHGPAPPSLSCHTQQTLPISTILVCCFEFLNSWLFPPYPHISLNTLFSARQLLDHIKTTETFTLRFPSIFPGFLVISSLYSHFSPPSSGSHFLLDPQSPDPSVTFSLCSWPLLSSWRWTLFYCAS